MPAQRAMNQYLPHLLSICELDAVFIRQGHRLTQHTTPHESPWPTHLSWALQSTIAALRLMLAGHTVGAAIVLRQQLGRWTVLLAYGVARRDDEPIESFIARAWTHARMLGIATYAPDIAARDIFDDLDEHPPTTGVIDTDHQHVPIDGRALCPAAAYHTLSTLVDIEHVDQCAQPEAVHDLDAEDSATNTDRRPDALSDALALCIMQMRLAAAALCHTRRDTDTAQAIVDASGHERPLIGYRSDTQPRRRKSELPQLTRALVPLTSTRSAALENIDHLSKLYTDYHTVLADRSHCQHRTPQELAHLAFTAHRFTRALVAQAAHTHDRQLADQRLQLHQHLTPTSPHIMTAEFAALCAHWNQSQPPIAAAATQISATLLSGYWLWLEDDDRAMGILRCTLHHTTRLRLWHTNPDAAHALQTTPTTTPSTWMHAAGWSQHTELDHALFEFAHTNRESRRHAARIHLDEHYPNCDNPLPQRIARQTALDQLTALAATETMKVVATHQSPAIADTLREALHHHGLDEQTNPARRQPNKRTSAPRTKQDTTTTPDITLLD
ncbi:hypothetical protein [Mycobacterium rhizamassiliense]|nr:hypothetical protein [Mycobacterium rhizamassiliense]